MTFYKLWHYWLALIGGYLVPVYFGWQWLGVLVMIITTMLYAKYTHEDLVFREY